MLTKCPACKAQISAKARACIHCGHPMIRQPSYAALLPFVVLLLFLIAGLGAIFELNPNLRLADFLPSTTEEQESTSAPEAPPAKLDKKTLQKELQAYALRLNRLTPYKPNPVLTLQRVYVDSKPASIIFDYEVVDTYDNEYFRSGAVRDVLMRRYCTDEDFAFLAVNEVHVSFRYLRRGRMIHLERISRCELAL